ncbi:MAG: hypothetical protein IJ593_06670, partial [Lachnospiraceae bacterium]|nr:hypothetical protein [Lachnospiraceae bacterium]
LNKCKLNGMNTLGLVVNASIGFYDIVQTVTQSINDVHVQAQIKNTYYFNELGEMVTGFIKTVDNKTYFFDNSTGADMGKMVIGWKKIQNDWYYFNLDGSMLVSSTTPDGYLVGADGKMM